VCLFWNVAYLAAASRADRDGAKSQKPGPLRENGAGRGNGAGGAGRMGSAPPTIYGTSRFPLTQGHGFALRKAPAESLVHYFRIQLFEEVDGLVPLDIVKFTLL
jgi:hypothetical protein